MPDLSVGDSPASTSPLSCFVFLHRSRYHLAVHRMFLCTCLLSTGTLAPWGGDFVRYPARCLLQGLACCRHSADACQQANNSRVGLSQSVCCQCPPRVEQLASPDRTCPGASLPPRSFWGGLLPVWPSLSLLLRLLPFLFSPAPFL